MKLRGSERKTQGEKPAGSNQKAATFPEYDEFEICAARQERERQRDTE